MLFRLAADVVVALHFGFIVFVVAGGFLVWRWRRLAWVHLPVAAWGALIEFTGWICPLTPLENSLRARAGEGVYQHGFVEEYLLPVLYPATLTYRMQLLLGAGVLLVNLLVYGWVWRTLRARQADQRSTSAASSVSDEDI